MAQPAYMQAELWNSSRWRLIFVWSCCSLER